MRVLLMAAVLAATAFGGAANAVTDWKGTSILNGGKGYVDAPLGQLHYRDIGPKTSRRVVLLVHQSPMWMIELGPLQNELASRGIRTIAFDSPGYGLSDRPPGKPEIADYADNMAVALGKLKVAKVVVIGRHTGASISVSFAARHPAMTAGLVVSGNPLFTEAEGKQKLLNKRIEVNGLKADGSHLTPLFAPGWSGYSSSKDTDPDVYGRTWMTVGLMMQGEDQGHPAVYRYVMEPDWRRIKAPALIVTYPTDTVHWLDVRSKEMRPDATLVTLNVNPYAFLTNPKQFADVLVPWMQKLP